MIRDSYISPRGRGSVLTVSGHGDLTLMYTHTHVVFSIGTGSLCSWPSYSLAAQGFSFGAQLFGAWFWFAGQRLLRLCRGWDKARASWAFGQESALESHHLWEQDRHLQGWISRCQGRDLPLGGSDGLSGDSKTTPRPLSQGWPPIASPSVSL